MLKWVWVHATLTLTLIWFLIWVFRASWSGFAMNISLYLSLFWLPDLGFGVVSGMDLVEFVSIWWFVLRFGGLWDHNYFFFISRWNKQRKWFSKHFRNTPQTLKKKLFSVETILHLKTFYNETNRALVQNDFPTTHEVNRYSKEGHQDSA